MCNRAEVEGRRSNQNVANFSPAGKVDLRQFANGELFGDALSYIDNTHDFPSTGSCVWESKVAQAQGLSSGPKDYGGGPVDLNDLSPVEHNYWCNDTFLCSDLAARFAYQGILDHCERYECNRTFVTFP